MGLLTMILSLLSSVCKIQFASLTLLEDKENCVILESGCSCGTFWKS